MEVQLSLSNILYKCACGHSIKCDNEANVMNVETYNGSGVHIICAECFEKGLFSVDIIYDPENCIYSDYAFMSYQSEIEIIL